MSPPLTKLWAGRIYGTNTGNIFIEFTETGPKVSGIIRLRDDALGMALYSISGTYGELLTLTGQPQHPPEGLQVGVISVEGKLTTAG